MKDELLSVYYELFDIFESIEVLALALKELAGVKMCKSALINHLEATRLYHVHKELEMLYDTDIRVLRAFKIKCKSIGYQTTIDDFL